MWIKFNNEEKELPEGTSIARLVETEAGTTAGIAVALNGRLVKRESWETTFPAEGDNVLLIKAAYGG